LLEFVERDVVYPDVHFLLFEDFLGIFIERNGGEWHWDESAFTLEAWVLDAFFFYEERSPRGTTRDLRDDDSDGIARLRAEVLAELGSRRDSAHFGSDLMHDSFVKLTCITRLEAGIEDYSIIDVDD